MQDDNKPKIDHVEKKNEVTQNRKLEIIDDALLEQVSGGLVESICVPVQFCVVPPRDDIEIEP